MQMVTITKTVGASPPRPARPVSLALRSYVKDAVRAGTEGLVFAVSGGADSVALAVAGADVAVREKVPYAAAIVDHGMREESAEEAGIVAASLREWGVENVVVLSGRATVGKGGVENAARTLRYGLLEDFARTWGEGLRAETEGATEDESHGTAHLLQGRGLPIEDEVATKDEYGMRNLGESPSQPTVDILLGHTLDDQAETVLLRLGRGSSPRSLAGMRPRTRVGPGLYRGRPLLSLRRRDTESFCSSLGLTWIDDPTNALDGPWKDARGKPLPRVAVRHRALPALADALGQDPVPALGRVAALLAEDEDALRLLTQQAWEECRVEEGIIEDCAEKGEVGVSSLSTMPVVPPISIRSLAVAASPVVSPTISVSSPADLMSSPAPFVRFMVDPLLRYPPAIRRRLYLLAWGIRGKSVPLRPALSATHLLAVDQLVTNSSSGPRSPIGKQVELPGGIRVRRERQFLVFSQVKP